VNDCNNENQNCGEYLSSYKGEKLHFLCEVIDENAPLYLLKVECRPKEFLLLIRNGIFGKLFGRFI
jgi:hypothetical protein